jgi:hypothetical protein
MDLLPNSSVSHRLWKQDWKPGSCRKQTPREGISARNYRTNRQCHSRLPECLDQTIELLRRRSPAAVERNRPELRKPSALFGHRQHVRIIARASSAPTPSPLIDSLLSRGNSTSHGNALASSQRPCTKYATRSPPHSAATRAAMDAFHHELKFAAPSAAAMPVASNAISLPIALISSDPDFPCSGS